MKSKFTAYIIHALLLLVIVMLLSTTVWAQETTLQTVIPSSHTISMEMIGNGTVFVNGVAYTHSADIQVQRQHRPEISILETGSSRIKTVLWCGEDVTTGFQSGTWLAPVSLEDAVLVVQFEQLSSTPQTGDDFTAEFGTASLLLALFALAVCMLYHKKKLA